MVRNLPAMWETQVWSPGQEDPLEKEMVTHSSILAWRIPWIKEPGGLQSMGSQRVRHDWATNPYPLKKYCLACNDGEIWSDFFFPFFSSCHNVVYKRIQFWHIYTYMYICCAQSLSNVLLFVTPWAVAHQASLSLGLFRQEYWSGLPFPPPGDLLDLGIKLVFPVSPGLAGGFFTAEPPGKPNIHTLLYIKQITKESLLYGTGNYIQHLIITNNRK